VDEPGVDADGELRACAEGREARQREARRGWNDCAGDPRRIALAPRALALDYDVLFWMNESAPEDQLSSVERPVKIMSCILPSCETRPFLLG